MFSVVACYLTGRSIEADDQSFETLEAAKAHALRLHRTGLVVDIIDDSNNRPPITSAELMRLLREE